MKISDLAMDQVNYCSSNTSIPEVAKILYENYIRAVYVKDDDDIIGIISDQAILRNLSEGKDLSKLLAKDLMRRDFPKLDKNTSIEDAFKIIDNNPFRTYAITSEGKIIGAIPKSRIIYGFSEEEKYYIYNLKERIQKIKL